jgi:hypothetical protein
MALPLLKQHSVFYDNKKHAGPRIQSTTNTTFTRLPKPKWIDTEATSNGSFSSSSSLISASLDDPHSMNGAKGNAEFKVSHANIRDLNWGPQTDFNWESVARNDLESFIWVMLYAFCVKEMNSKPPTKGMTGRTWYCQNTFIPLFGEVSFLKTFQVHSFASEAMIDERSDAMQIWKLNRVPELRYWDIMGVLMASAKSGKLDHATFQAILKHYIQEERNIVAGSS